MSWRSESAGVIQTLPVRLNPNGDWHGALRAPSFFGFHEIDEPLCVSDHQTLGFVNELNKTGPLCRGNRSFSILIEEIVQATLFGRRHSLEPRWAWLFHSIYGAKAVGPGGIIAGSVDPFLGPSAASCSLVARRTCSKGKLSTGD